MLTFESQELVRNTDPRLSAAPATESVWSPCSKHPPGGFPVHQDVRTTPVFPTSFKSQLTHGVPRPAQKDPEGACLCRLGIYSNNAAVEHAQNKQCGVNTQKAIID